MFTTYESINIFFVRGGDQRMCVRVASWVGTAGLQYAAPCETSDQMLLLRMVLKSSSLFAFLVFGLSGFPLERVAPRRFFQNSFIMTTFCVFFFFVFLFFMKDVFLSSYNASIIFSFFSIFRCRTRLYGLVRACVVLCVRIQ